MYMCMRWSLLYQTPVGIKYKGQHSHTQVALFFPRRFLIEQIIRAGATTTSKAKKSDLKLLIKRYKLFWELKE